MKDLKIRYAKDVDAEMLASLGAETFWDTYRRESHLEQKYIRAYIAKTFTGENLKFELEQKEKIIYLIAESEDEEVGYVRLLVENTREEIRAKKPIEISRIYLRQKFWGRKFGKTLLERCFAEAEKQACDVIWLSVWHQNKRAIAFYEKFGFYNVGSHIFDLASSPQIDLLMQKELTKEKGV